ncbi:hypothetical protein BUALT_Bualt18G0009000 [Buddleja alternifolia]|uniref:NAC domain-containing protein n=1 Tax=Buddleja alternifolia TaxID=168488 RepID=A0AAV6W7Y9_9LAMI|nr:hypothetical protein BUALT_Bualt18G0009000 [Buddleja alternifolia]
MSNDQVMVPEGFRFVPTEEELIRSYLLKKAMGLPLPSKHILEKEVYGEKASPWDVLSDVSEAYWDLHVPMNIHDEKEKQIKKVKKTIYVFTRLKRVNGRIRFARIAGCGTWKGQAVRTIYNINREEIGMMKTFTFIANNKGGGLINDHWIMHEYSLSGVSLRRVVEDKDYVICRITREFFEETKKILSCQPQERQPHIPAPCLDLVRYSYSNDQFMLQEENTELGEKSTTHVQTEDDFLDCDFDIDEILMTLQEIDQQEPQPISPCFDLVRYSDNNQLTTLQEESELGKKRSFEKEDEILSCNKKQKKILMDESSSFEEGNSKSYIMDTTDPIVTWEELGSIADPVELSSHNDFNISLDDYEYGDGDGYFCDFGDQLEDGDIGNSNNVPLSCVGFLMPRQTEAAYIRHPEQQNTPPVAANPCTPCMPYEQPCSNGGGRKLMTTKSLPKVSSHGLQDDIGNGN